MLNRNRFDLEIDALTSASFDADRTLPLSLTNHGRGGFVLLAPPPRDLCRTPANDLAYADLIAPSAAAS